MMHTAKSLAALEDRESNCKWVNGTRCSWDANTDNVNPACLTFRTLFNLVYQKCVYIDPSSRDEL
eukprot:9615188-Karenia_brevis.AAC.1